MSSFGSNPLNSITSAPMSSKLPTPRNNKSGGGGGAGSKTPRSIATSNTSSPRSNANAGQMTNNSFSSGAAPSPQGSSTAAMTPSKSGRFAVPPINPAAAIAARNDALDTPLQSPLFSSGSIASPTNVDGVSGATAPQQQQQQQQQTKSSSSTAPSLTSPPAGAALATTSFVVPPTAKSSTVGGPAKASSRRYAGGAAASTVRTGNSQQRRAEEAASRLRALRSHPRFRLLVSIDCIMFFLRMRRCLMRRRHRLFVEGRVMPRCAFIIQCAYRRFRSLKRMKVRSAAKIVNRFLKPVAAFILQRRRGCALVLERIGRAFLDRQRLCASGVDRKRALLRRVLRKPLLIAGARRERRLLEQLKEERELFLENAMLVFQSIIREERMSVLSVREAMFASLSEAKRLSIQVNPNPDGVANQSMREMLNKALSAVTDALDNRPTIDVWEGSTTKLFSSMRLAAPLSTNESGQGRSQRPQPLVLANSGVSPSPPPTTTRQDGQLPTIALLSSSVSPASHTLNITDTTKKTTTAAALLAPAATDGWGNVSGLGFSMLSGIVDPQTQSLATTVGPHHGSMPGGPTVEDSRLMNSGIDSDNASSASPVGSDRPSPSSQMTATATAPPTASNRNLMSPSASAAMAMMGVSANLRSPYYGTNTDDDGTMPLTYQPSGSAMTGDGAFSSFSSPVNSPSRGTAASGGVVVTPRHAAVIGAGNIGIEFAEALQSHRSMRKSKSMRNHRSATAPPDDVQRAFLELIEQTESLQRKAMQLEMSNSLKDMRTHVGWCVQVLTLREDTPKPFISLLPQLSPVWVLRAGVQLFQDEAAARAAVIEEYESTPLMFLSRPIIGVNSEKRRKRMKELLQQQAEKLFETHVGGCSGSSHAPFLPSHHLRAVSGGSSRGSQPAGAQQIVQAMRQMAEVAAAAAAAGTTSIITSSLSSALVSPSDPNIAVDLVPVESWKPRLSVGRASVAFFSDGLLTPSRPGGDGGGGGGRLRTLSTGTTATTITTITTRSRSTTSFASDDGGGDAPFSESHLLHSTGGEHGTLSPIAFEQQLELLRSQRKAFVPVPPIAAAAAAAALAASSSFAPRLSQTARPMSQIPGVDVETASRNLRARSPRHTPLTTSLNISSSSSSQQQQQQVGATPIVTVTPPQTSQHHRPVVSPRSGRFGGADIGEGSQLAPDVSPTNHRDQAIVEPLLSRYGGADLFIAPSSSTQRRGRW